MSDISQPDFVSSDGYFHFYSNPRDDPDAYMAMVGRPPQQGNNFYIHGRGCLDQLTDPTTTVDSMMRSLDAMCGRGRVETLLQRVGRDVKDVRIALLELRVRDLSDQVETALTLDLHEGGGTPP